MKKILIHAYSNLNLGDDLFLKILKDRYPNQEFYLIDGKDSGIYSSFKYFRKQSFIERVIGKLFHLMLPAKEDMYTSYIERRRIQQAAKDYDCYVLLGGSMFIQNQKGCTSNDKLKIEAIKRFNHSFVIGANFGPFIEDAYFNQYKQILSKCDGVAFRDSYSYSLFSELKNISQNPDIVFQLQFDNIDKIKDTVGISLINLSSRSYLKHQADNYFTYITEVVKKLLSDGKKVVLFSFCRPEGDETAIKRITDVINDKNLTVVFYTGDIENFLRKYSSMEAMLCTRFHAMILSLIFKQKLLPLVYSNKMTQVLEDIGYKDHYIDLQYIEKYSVDESLQQLYSSEFLLPDHIRKASEKMFAVLDDYLTK